MTSVFVRARKRRDGTSTFFVVLQRGGRGSPQEVLASGLTNRREAERLAREAKLAAEQARAGTYRSRLTVGMALDLYLESLKGRPSHETQERNARLHLRPRFDGVCLRDLARGEVQQLVDDLVSAGLGAQSVRHIAGLLGTAVEHARERGRYTGDNMARPLRLPKVTRRAKDVLRPEEAAVVLPHVPDRWRPLTGVMLYTCMRPGELAALRRADVDVARRIITVRRSWERNKPKDGDERIVPLPLVALPFLEEALERADDSDFVFPGPDGGLMPRPSDTKLARMLRTAMVCAAEQGASSLVTHWTLKCRRKLSDRSMCGYARDVDAYTRDERCPDCGMRLWPVGHARRVRFYDLRHSGASLLIQGGASATVVSAMLGHHDVEFTMRTYVDLAPDALRAEVDRATTHHVKVEGSEPVMTITSRKVTR